MAEQKIALTVEANVGSLRSQIKEATGEVIALSQKFGQFSPEAVKAAKKVAELKDQLQDAKDLTAALDPGKKFAAVSSAIQTVTGSFAALQGGLALFGVESKEVEKQLLKVQGALALSEGISTILNAAEGFGLLASTIRSKVITAFSSLKGALIATGIGAFAVGLGLIIANFEKVSSVINKIIPGFDKFTNSVRNGIQAITDFIGITSAQERALESLGNEVARRNDERERSIKILTAQTGQEAKIYELRQNQIKDELKLLEQRTKAGEKLSQEEIKRQLNLSSELQANDIAERVRIKNKNEEAQKERDRLAKERAAKEKQRQEELFETEKEATEKRIKTQREIAGLTEKDIQAVGDRSIQRQNEILAKGFEIDDAKLKNLGRVAGEEIKKQQEVAKNKLINDQVQILSEKNKQNAISATSDILAGLSDIVGRQTAAGKVLAIASTTIDTFQAAQSAYKSLVGIPVVGPALATAAAITASIAGLKRIQAIKNVQVPGQTGTVGGGIPSLPSNASAPLAAPTPTVGVTRLDAATVNNLGNKAVRAYVLETDITDQQTRQRRIERAAVLGG